MSITKIGSSTEGQLWTVQELCTPLVTSNESNSAYDLVHVVAAPKGGPPPHVHHREDEMFYVIDGTFSFLLNDRYSIGGPGTCMFLPRDIVHTYNNIGDKPGHLLVGTAPSGLMQFLIDASIPATDPQTRPDVDPATLEKLNAACKKHEIDLLPNWPAPKPAPPREKSRELWVTKLHIKLLLTSEQTNGSFSVCEITGAPGTFVPPHTHDVEDEFFYVLDGEFEFHVDGKDVPAPAGTFIHVPKGTLHGFRNVSAAPAKLVDYHTPGGFEKFFEAAGTVCTDAANGPPDEPIDVPKFLEVCAAHGMTVPPPK